MKKLIEPKPTAVEGMRERKRRQTHERIMGAAMTLFLERGYDAATIEEIAAAADVSKRSFFDYFPTKEDVLSSWQDDFGDSLVAAVAARPVAEPPAVAVEEALTASIAAASNPRAIGIARLIQETPSLQAWDQLKYAKLEQKLAGALASRATDEPGRFRARLLSMIVIGALRLTSEEWLAQENPDPSGSQAFTRQAFRLIWNELAEFARTSSKE